MAFLTYQEEEMQEIKKLEVGVDIGVDTKHQTLAGVAFPIVTKALDAVKQFASGELQYVQLKIGQWLSFPICWVIVSGC